MKTKIALILSLIASVLVGCELNNTVETYSNFDKNSIVIKKAAEILEVSPEKITRENLLQITALKITEKDIEDVNTAYDFSIISEMKNIKRLELTNIKVLNTGFLSSLNKLEVLNISNCEISEINSIKDLNSLEILYIRKNYISDVTPLTNLNRLKTLNLNENPIGDISMLSNLKKLERLEIKDTSISDISVVNEMTSLNQLDIRGSKVKSIAPLREVNKPFELFLIMAEIEDLDTIKSNTNIMLSEEFLG